MGKTVPELSELAEQPASGDLLYLVDVSDTTDSASGTSKKVQFSNLSQTVASASTSAEGIVELATDAETITGTDTARAVTPSNITAKMDTDGTLAGNLDTRIPSQKAVKTYVDTQIGTQTSKTYNTPVIKSWDSWQPYTTVTPTTGTFDAPSYPIVFAGVDLTSVLYPGMRVKITQSTDKYFIVTKVEFSTDTTVTLYGGTDYSLVASGTTAISAFSYSSAKVPAGFPLQREKWTTKATYTSDTTQSTPTSGTWYNIGSFVLNVPIGSWDLGYSASYRLNDTVTAAYAFFSTLSTANNSESDNEMTFVLDGLGGAIGYASSHAVKRKPGGVTVSSKTPYYLNAKVQDTGVDSIVLRGVSFPCVIDAVCAYL